jgi:predicted amidohydrolase
MKRLITIAAVQPNAQSCHSEDEFYNKMRRLSYTAKQNGAKVIVFPEGLSMWLSWCKESKSVKAFYSGQMPDDVSAFGMRSWVEKLTDWFFKVVKLKKMGEWMAQLKFQRIMERTFSSIAQELNVVIVAGSLYTQNISGMQNISMVFENDGKLVGTPGKKYLMPIEESWGFKAAADIAPVQTSAGCIGVCICYDLSFPDVTQTLKDKGAEFICAPSGGWRPYPGYPFDEVKDMPQRERAKETGLHIVRPYQCGWMEPGMFFDGRTSIVDKNGDIIKMSQSTSGEEVVMIDLEIG